MGGVSGVVVGSLIALILSAVILSFVSRLQIKTQKKAEEEIERGLEGKKCIPGEVIYQTECLVCSEDGLSYEKEDGICKAKYGERFFCSDLGICEEMVCNPWEEFVDGTCQLRPNTCDLNSECTVQFILKDSFGGYLDLIDTSTGKHLFKIPCKYKDAVRVGRTSYYYYYTCTFKPSEYGLVEGRKYAGRILGRRGDKTIEDLFYVVRSSEASNFIEVDEVLEFPSTDVSVDFFECLNEGIGKYVHYYYYTYCKLKIFSSEDITITLCIVPVNASRRYAIPYSPPPTFNCINVQGAGDIEIRPVIAYEWADGMKLNYTIEIYDVSDNLIYSSLPEEEVSQREHCGRLCERGCYRRVEYCCINPDSDSQYITSCGVGANKKCRPDEKYKCS